jgi:uncharacterized protein (TIGR04562 family)
MIPKRSRNTIMGLDQFKRHVSKLRRALKEDRISSQVFADQIEYDFDYDEAEAIATNPHTSASYKSIQLTCRQLIRYQNPVNQWQDKVEAFLAEIPSDERTIEQKTVSDVVEMAKKWQVLRKQDEISVFYPFEVQILDAGSNKEIEQGLASHDRYKKSQVRTARKRILEQIL